MDFYILFTLIAVLLVVLGYLILEYIKVEKENKKLREEIKPYLQVAVANHRKKGSLR